MRNKILSLAVVLIMLMTLSLNVSAQETYDSSSQPKVELSKYIKNTSKSLTNKQAQVIFGDIKKQLLFEYGDIYSFHNFSGEFENERIEDGSTLIDVNIYADMTLTRHPSDSPFIKGMVEAVSEIDDEAEKGLIQDKINGYINEIETLYYNKPDASVFIYTIKLKSNTLKTDNLLDKDIQYELFYRTDVTSEEIILEPVGKLVKVEDYALAEESGREVVSEIKSDIIKSSIKASGFYDRLEARDYALDHATDTPEFSGDQSDCANFVSKSLNHGGIPVDKSGKWYPSTDGTVNTCGINWMRTGYYNNGGVVPYMTGKDYFYKESDTSKVFAGSIMYWTKTSHVALVTYGDGTTIKYTQHSNKKLSSSAAKNVVYKTSISANFYKPESSIMK